MEFVEFIKTPMVKSVTLRRPFSPNLEGTLCVTGHHLIVSSRSESNAEELWMIHGNVDSVEKKLTGSGGVLTLKCKDFLIYHLDFQSAEDCINVASSVESLSNIDNYTLSYPFFYRPMFTMQENGWHAYQPETEINRFKDCSEDWRISYVNKDFKVCPTYPQAVFVPKTVDDETIIKAATFRQGGRFPVLVYCHKHTKAVMMRCSQPLTGPNGKRCKEDERLVNSVMGMGKRGYIFDTRTTGMAKMAQNKGGGTEMHAHYSQWRTIHQDLERRQNFHDSLIKMIEACNDSNITMDKWLSKLESSNWLTHVKNTLYASCLVALSLDKEQISVLIHGSEGTDTTLLVSSLTQVILDHDCRTVTGMQALIEREWIQAGHPFRSRCLKSAFAISKNRQEAPVFLLFLDCVWQIWQQFPCSFQFNEKFLITIFQHSYSSSFGTFLCNNAKERSHCNLKERTFSLWSYLNRPEVLQEFMNPMYEPNPCPIWPSVAPQSLNVWMGLYFRGIVDQAPQEEAWLEIYKIREYDKELKLKADKLRHQLASLEKEAMNHGIIATSTEAGLDTSDGREGSA